MAELIRYKDCGCLIAEDLGSRNPKYTYTGTEEVGSPFGHARSFSGSDSIEVNDYFRFLSTGNSISIIFKFKLGTDTGHEVIIDNRSHNGTNYKGFCVVNRQGFIRAQVFTGSGGTAIQSETTTNYYDGKWHTAVLNYDNGGLLQIFIDGSLGASASLGASDYSTESPLRIGIKTDTPSSYTGYTGELKEVIIDNRIWSQQEMTNYHENKVFDYDKYLISRWKLDDTSLIKDLGWRGLGNDGLVINAPILENSPFGKSLSFDGVNDYISFNDTGLEINNDDTTISAWIRLTGTFSGTQYIIAKGDSSGYYQIRRISDTNVSLVLYNGSSIISKSINLGDNAWHKVTMVFDRTNNLFNSYLDGRLQSSQDLSSYSPLVTNKPLYFSTYTGTSAFYLGSIGDVMIYKKALSNLQVKDLYNKTKRNEL